MSNSTQSVQALTQTQTQQTVQPPKKAPTTTQKAFPQDTVTISKASQQAQAGNTNAVASGDKDHDGDNA
jgi:hypothetical protein